MKRWKKIISVVLALSMSATMFMGLTTVQAETEEGDVGERTPFIDTAELARYPKISAGQVTAEHGIWKNLYSGLQSEYAVELTMELRESGLEEYGFPAIRVGNDILKFHPFQNEVKYQENEVGAWQTGTKVLDYTFGYVNGANNRYKVYIERKADTLKFAMKGADDENYYYGAAVPVTTEVSETMAMQVYSNCCATYVTSCDVYCMNAFIDNEELATYPNIYSSTASVSPENGIWKDLYTDTPSDYAVELTMELRESGLQQWSYTAIRVGNDILKFHPCQNEVKYRENGLGDWTTGTKKLDYDFGYVDGGNNRYKVYIERKADTLKFAIKGADDEDYYCGTSIPVTTEVPETMAMQVYSNNCWTFITSRDVYSLLLLTASVDEIQPRHAGEKITVKFDYEIEALTESTIRIENAGDSEIYYDCPVEINPDNSKELVITLLDTLDVNTEYNVVLTGINSAYTIGLANDTIGFRTVNAAYEVALTAVNTASTQDEMVTALTEVAEGSNSEGTFTPATNVAEALEDPYLSTPERKATLAQFVIDYREENGNFANFDFSDLALAVQECTTLTKIASYKTDEGITEDIFGIFTSYVEGNSAEKVTALKTLFKNEISSGTYNTQAELTGLVDKASYVTELGTLTGEELISKIDENVTVSEEEKIYTLDKEIIDVEDEDYTSNKQRTVELMTTFHQGFYEKISDLSANFNISKGLAAINAVLPRGSYSDLFTKYAEVMGLDLTEYNSVGADICDIYITASTCNTVEELKTAIANGIRSAKKAIQNKNNQSNKNNSYGGYTGSSSSSTSNMTTSLVTKQPIANEKVVFSDIATVSWAEEAITALKDKKIVSGVSETEYQPQRSVTRAEFVAFIARAFNLNTKGEMSFDDVNNNDWFYDVVNCAYSAGIVSGDGKNFLPNNEIKREDAAVILSNVLKGYSIPEDEKAEFADNQNISVYAQESVKELAAKNILNGSDGFFNPKNSLTRAEAAVLIYKVMTAINIL